MASSSMPLVPASQVSVATNATHSVSVPCGVGPGDTFRLCLQSQGSASRQFRIRVPPNHTPGTRLRVELPAKGSET